MYTHKQYSHQDSVVAIYMQGSKQYSHQEAVGSFTLVIFSFQTMMGFSFDTRVSFHTRSSFDSNNGQFSHHDGFQFHTNNGQFSH